MRGERSICCDTWECESVGERSDDAMLEKQSSEESRLED